jgi:hypothetical protein
VVAVEHINPEEQQMVDWVLLGVQMELLMELFHRVQQPIVEVVAAVEGVL